MRPIRQSIINITTGSKVRTDEIPPEVRVLAGKIISEEGCDAPIGVSLRVANDPERGDVLYVARTTDDIQTGWGPYAGFGTKLMGIHEKRPGARRTHGIIVHAGAVAHAAALIDDAVTPVGGRRHMASGPTGRTTPRAT